MELTQRQLKKLPWQASGIWLMYQAGIDPRDHLALSTYYQYKRILKSHGLDLNPKTLKHK